MDVLHQFPFCCPQLGCPASDIHRSRRFIDLCRAENRTHFHVATMTGRVKLVKPVTWPFKWRVFTHRLCIRLAPFPQSRHDIWHFAKGLGISEFPHVAPTTIERATGETFQSISSTHHVDTVIFALARQRCQETQGQRLDHVHLLQHTHSVPALPFDSNPHISAISPASTLHQTRCTTHLT